jgi:beta-glucosidase-like glycosyl hydrolase
MPADTTPLSLNDARHQWVEERLASLSLSEAVGQLLLGAFFRQPLDPALPLFASGKLGSILPAPLHMATPQAAREAIEKANRGAKIPVLAAADFEAGVGLMVKRGATRLPPAIALGAQPTRTLRLDAARMAGRIVAHEALAIGVRLNFAPVADLATHQANAAINSRSFGSDPQIVAAMVAEQIATAQALGLACCAKHFPGHGPASGDSHVDLPVCVLKAPRLEEIEMEPFRAAIAAGVATVMVAHVHYPALQPPDEWKTRTPASLSASIVTGLLREKLGFRGVIVTDSLAMGAIAAAMSPGEAVVAALKAGNDLLIIESDFALCHAAILEAVRRSELSKDRIFASARRVLELKARVGLAEEARPPFSLETVGTPQRAGESLALARSALAWTGGSLSSLRERLAEGGRVNILGFFNADSARASGSPALLAAALGQEPASALAIRDDSSADDIRRADALIDNTREPLLVALFRRPIAYRPDGLGLSPQSRRLFDRAIRRAAALMIQGVPFGAPEWDGLPREAPILVAWGADSACSLAVAEALLGNLEPQKYRSIWPADGAS